MSLAGGALTTAPAALPDATEPAARALPRAAGPSVRSLLTASGDQPPLTVPRDPAREAARHELSKGMYHENDPSLVERALNAFWDWIGKLFETAASATPGGTVGLIVVIVAVLAVIGALWWRLGTPRRHPVSAAVLFDDRPRSAAEHRSAAEAHAAQSHWNQAVQERMRAIVRSLEERALLDVRPGRTADEAATAAGRPLPSHAARLRTAARDFDDVTYGGRSATPTSYQRIADLDRDLERARPHLASSTAAHAHKGPAE
ncbi:DUF4129 domain-containing protein [Streptomyces griseoviridis]